jgi:carbamoyl-phosphate synthase large subunit
VQLGYRILATDGTAKLLMRHGIEVTRVSKHSDADSDRTIIDMIDAGEVDVIVNTPTGAAARADGYEIRAAATAANTSLFTTVAQLNAVIGSFEAIRERPFSVKTLQQHALERKALLVG